MITSPNQARTTQTVTAPVTPRVSTMRAIVQDRYGSTDVLEFRDIDKPEIPADEQRLALGLTA